MGIRSHPKLVGLTSRPIQQHIEEVREYLGFRDISSHSFRKYFSTSMYENNASNVELVRTLLQYSCITTTQRYLGVQQKLVEDALNKHVKLI